jgi:hypothetical protein
LAIAMAFLADPGVPRPLPSTRLALPFDRSDWIPVVVTFAAFLVAILSLYGSLASRERTDLGGQAVCEQRTFPPGLFFLALH